MRTRVVAATAGVFAVLLLSLLITPIITPDQDASVYLAAARGYLGQGLSSQYPREPFYPLFLGALEALGVPPARFLALVQNGLFVAGLFFFLRSLHGPRMPHAEALAASALVTLIPTFLLPMNGAMYTESLSCTLAFLMLGSLVRIFETGAAAARPSASGFLRAAGWAIAAASASAALALIKGPFLHVNVALGLAGAAAAAFIRRSPARRLMLAASFLGVAIAAWGATAAWQASRTPPLANWERGGSIFYGRTEFAARFDFRRQTVPFLLNALSESACRRIYGAECAAYTFEAENGLGFSERERVQGDEQILFARGFRRIAEQPLRQVVFAAFELARFVLHHGTTGFATIVTPVLGRLLSSPGTALLLKLFNALLYLVPPAAWFVLRRRGRRVRDVWRAWPDAMRFGTGLYLAYACLYLGAYAFATTLLRMVYPVAPLLVVFDVEVIRATRALARSEPAAG